jgi:CelD/BcsL family acetyltransferase involved in cellulose biosynthesis
MKSFPHRTRLLKPAQLTQDHIAAWSEIQQSNSAWDSPYFRPEFTLAVAKVRDDVEVGVLEENGTPVGFFPFQRGLLNAGKPVGGLMSDFHGVIARDEARIRPASLLRDCRLSSWNFNHLVAPQPVFAQSIWTVAESPYIDLSHGYEHYVTERRKQGSQLVGQAIKKAGKIAKSVGPLRFVLNANEEDVFRSLLTWKTAQYKHSGAPNVFGVQWTIDLLRKILERDGEHFAGMMSALYVGDQLAAVHLGMRSNNVLHFWFPAYDVEFAKHSVGLILMLEMARACESLGIHRIDMGKGPESYKREFMNGASTVAEGSVARHPFATNFRRAWHGAREYVKSSPFAGTAKSVRSWFGPARQWMLLH